MKLTNHLFTTRKIVLAALALFSLAGVGTAAPSIFHDAHYESGALSFNQSVLTPSQSFLGPLTLDESYAFDYATAGIGTTTFRHLDRRTFFTPIQDMPRAVGTSNSSFNSSSTYYMPSFESSYLPGGFSVGEDSADSGFNPLTPVPEPSTWIGGILALAAIGLTQRRRLRALVARGA
jgi:hypothetical protein